MFSYPNISIIKDFILDPKVIAEDALAIIEKNNLSIKINYSDTDPSDSHKPVMVLIHGNSASKKVFDEHIKYFASDYRVIALDLLGHGLSTKLGELENIAVDEKDKLCAAFYNPLAMMAEVASLLQSLQLKSVHLVGWSLGGHIAYGVAALNPELVASILTIGSPPVKFCHEGMKKGFSEWFVNVLLPEWINTPTKTSLNDARGVAVHIGFTGKDIEIFAQDMVISDPQMRKYLFKNSEEYNSEKYSGTPLDAAKFLRETNMPVRMMVGENDVGISASCIAEAAKEMRHSLSAAHVVKGASHAVFKTHEEMFREEVRMFIESARASRKVEFK